MFCPICRTEYVEGVTECADCGVELVESLPEEESFDTEYIDHEPVLGTYNPGDVALLKSVLDSAGITYYFDGDAVNPMRTYVEPAWLYVKSDQVEEARDLIDGLELTYITSPPKDDEEYEDEDIDYDEEPEDDDDYIEEE
jgi:hypothetical protein